MKPLHGIYLVIDPQRDWDKLFYQLEAALKGGLNIVQIWNHWAKEVQMEEKQAFLHAIKTRCASFDVPVLMHDDWEMACQADLDGVHFDMIPDTFEDVQEALKGKVIGITVGNDVEVIRWSKGKPIDYISFCAVFPSSSVDRCEIVDQNTIRKAKAIVDIPVFLSGGIRIDNLKYLETLDFDGIALISGILDADDPAKAVQEYMLAFKKIKTA